MMSDQISSLMLPLLPDSAARIVRRAEDSCMYAVIPDLPLHILKVHAPHAALIDLKRAQHNVVAIILQRPGEADVSRRVDQHAVTPRTDYSESAYHAAENTVLIAYGISCESADIVANAVPLYD